VGALNDPPIVREAIRGVHVVFHLAAMKSIELCEANPMEAVDTNVHGTSAVIEAALSDPALERFVAISSSQASTPTSVYGLTKALVERIVANANGRSGADFGTVRCGNLWGSPGSVLDRWQEAARTGSELLVTDPQMTRFIMLRTEAVDLILEAASRRMAGGILCRLMPAYALADLAAEIAKSHGLKQHVTGARLGEKLHENLVSGAEAPFTDRDREFFTITPGRRSSGTEPFDSAKARRVTRAELRQLLTSESASPS
jgi:FlaA1/EpsC-like NDP-sugar epimerase